MNRYWKYIRSENNIIFFFVSIMVFSLLVGCSTTKNLPEGEILYTGIEKIDVADPNKTQEGDEAMQEVEAALSYPPNNSLFGSSTKRIPLPIGLWIYNGFKKYRGGIGKWIFDKFAAKPVFISTVNPDVRVAVSNNVLRENGYFDGHAAFEVIPDKKDSLKAKIRYDVEMNHAYRYDSIQYMRMRHFADTLIQANMGQTLLHKDDQFNVIKMENERRRISTLLRNNGFYYHRPDYMVFEADTLLTPGKVWLRALRKQGTPANALRPYRIGNISVYLSGYNGEQPNDSVQYKELTIHYHDKLLIRPPVLYGRFRFKPGDLYTQEEQQRTQTGLSRLSVFRYAEFQYTPQDTARRTRNDLLDVRVNSVYDLPYDGEFEVNASTKSNDYAGPGAIFTLTRRNAFKGGEILGVQLSGSYEWQTNSRAGQSKMNSYELGLSSTLTIPYILFPGYIYRDLVQPSSTTFRVGVDLLNRARFFRTISLSGNMTYDFRPTVTMRHSVTPFRLTFIKVNKTDLFKERAAENRSLDLSLQDQFIPAIGYTFTYDNTPIADRNFFSWTTSITESGNIIGGIAAIAGKDFNKEGKTLFGSPFAQFVKATSEMRYNFRIDRNNRLVARVMGGAIYSYGNSKISPYNEQFFIGGANSVRAYTIRSIGPGRYDPERGADGKPLSNYSYIDRTGDIKFEANLEYRFKIVGDLNGALFFDAGGIWAMRKDDRLGSRLRKGKFFNDLSLGTGAGLRYDLSFMIVRLDVGLGLHVPYKTDIDGYFNVNPFKKSNYYNALGWHLAIGYPF